MALQWKFFTVAELSKTLLNTFCSKIASEKVIALINVMYSSMIVYLKTNSFLHWNSYWLMNSISSKADIQSNAVHYIRFSSKNLLLLINL